MNQLDFLMHHFRYCESGTVELRAFKPEGGMADRLYTPLDDLARVSAFCSRNADNNIYFGVGVRDGAGGTAEHVTHIPCIWVDIDFKDTDKHLAWENLKRLPFKPSIVIKSGGGIHCYFYLSEPAEPKEFEQVLNADRRIAQALGGDFGAIDIPRVMRLPGTLNHKYTPPKECEVIDVEL